MVVKINFRIKENILMLQLSSKMIKRHSIVKLLHINILWLLVMVFICQDLKALWLSAKREFEDLQTQLYCDLKDLGMSYS